KINLGLNILLRRQDGFHEIESVFYPIPWRDILEIVPEKSGKGSASITSSGVEIPSDGKANLCEQVYQLMHEEFNLPSVKMHLHKIIPIGAGLGGGSADAAFTVTMLNELFNLKLTDDKLEQVVASVGSDCPFFIKNKAAYVTGRGEVLDSFELNLSGCWMLLVNPNIHIGTADAYAGVRIGQPEVSLKEVLKKPTSEWKGAVTNGFENSVFAKYPVLSELKDQFYRMGASYASMTGSGSTVFGIFETQPQLTVFSEEYSVKVVQL
ncbi:MAG: 4-(cytidine 5'-diphospho)-2-C-methyl-D-erythritol kinase, partial [Flavobacteriales bacterium]|nr:4-(cytidine 5'-diphospho)-2-C-methyl-D-erythritol kinase [Flavobacteriales bacterium]